ncbi:MAG: aminopeptidase, partial [Lysobacteraceae bacterium]
EKALLKEGKHLYLVDFSNKGGLVMPLIVEITTQSGKKTIERIPAEVWRMSPKKITKLFVTDEPIVGLTQDPYWETADIDVSNNSWPAKTVPSRLELFKSEREPMNNLMRDFNTKLAPPKAAGQAGEAPKAE